MHDRRKPSLCAGIDARACDTEKARQSWSMALIADLWSVLGDESALLEARCAFRVGKGGYAE